MTEPTAPTTPTPAAQPVAPVAPTPQATPAKEGPRSANDLKREARAGLRESMRSANTQESAEDPPAEGLGDESGLQEPTGEQPAEGQAQDGAEPHEAPAAEPAQDGDGEGEGQFVQVDIPEGHPVLEGLGLKGGIKVVDEESARAVRALANGTYKRVSEVQELKAELRRRDEELIKRDAHSQAAEEFKKSPDYQKAVERYNRIKEEEGPDEAKAYWSLVQRQMQDLVAKKVEEGQGKLEEREVQQAAQAWANEAYERTSRIPSEVRTLPHFRQLFEATVETFNADLERGLHENVVDSNSAHAVFTDIFKARLTADPEVRRVLTELSKRRAAAAPPSAAPPAAPPAGANQDPVEQFKRDAANRRRAAPPHPMGRLSQAAVTADGVAGGEEVDTSSMSPMELKRHHREKARAQARARFPS